MKTFRKVKIWILMATILVAMFQVSAMATSFDYNVVDNAGILTGYQIDNIKKELENLEDISVVLVINDVGTRTTDAYAYNVAKDTYQETLRNASSGIVIVYCNALEGFKIGIYSEGEYKIDDRELKRMIESSFNLYSTDSLWIEGSFISCVNYLEGLEEETIKASEQPINTPNDDTPQNTSRSLRSRILEFIGAYHVIISVVGAIFISGVIVTLIIIKRYQNQRDEQDKFY